MRSIKLYGYATSPYVRKTACFLYYKGVDFTHVPVNPVDPTAALGDDKGTQVPVLEIDNEWRLESSEHAHWLDELFPENPLYPLAHQKKIDEIDCWISDKFLTSIFRFAINDGNPIGLDFRFRAWRLAALVSAHTPLPETVRHKWPELLREAPFIQQMANHMDLNESYDDMRLRVFTELLSHLSDGPYMGGIDQPTMLDLAVFPQLVWGYMFGLEENLSAAMHTTVKAWLKRVSEHLPNNPTLIADEMQINSLAEALS
ncbi:glutathione S-transferase family protein [Pseudomaricurvus alkylphenolicus]|uniref:glutathione S-transferase family protein n=1 Tax=Pseudomaricurvus alkylphenolicus TaxID=1306991 RepID=UPI0014214085|nr:glutathione S-transferase family protein [Pseudomaricurvus alkylphenolicus]